MDGRSCEVNFGGVCYTPLFFGIKYLSPFKRSDGSQISQAKSSLQPGTIHSFKHLIRIYTYLHQNTLQFIFYKFNIDSCFV